MDLTIGGWVSPVRAVTRDPELRVLVGSARTAVAPETSAAVGDRVSFSAEALALARPSRATGGRPAPGSASPRLDRTV
jgi:hypothetical protein